MVNLLNSDDTDFLDPSDESVLAPSILKEIKAESTDNTDSPHTDDDFGPSIPPQKQERTYVSGSGRMSADIRLAAFQSFTYYSANFERSESLWHPPDYS